MRRGEIPAIRIAFLALVFTTTPKVKSEPSKLSPAGKEGAGISVSGISVSARTGSGEIADGSGVSGSFDNPVSEQEARKITQSNPQSSFFISVSFPTVFCSIRHDLRLNTGCLPDRIFHRTITNTPNRCTLQNHYTTSPFLAQSFFLFRAEKSPFPSLLKKLRQSKGCRSNELADVVQSAISDEPYRKLSASSS